MKHEPHVEGTTLIGSSGRLIFRGETAEAADARLALLHELAGSPRPYGNVKYADPKNGKYPIDTEEHVRAAVDYINKDKNAAEYPLNGVTLSSVKAAICRAAKEFKVEAEMCGGGDS